MSYECCSARPAKSNQQSRLEREASLSQENSAGDNLRRPRWRILLRTVPPSPFLLRLLDQPLATRAQNSKKSCLRRGEKLPTRPGNSPRLRRHPWNPRERKTARAPSYHRYSPPSEL